MYAQEDFLVSSQPTNEALAYVRAVEYRGFIEKEVLKVIKTLYDQGDVDRDHIQEIARHALSLLKPGLLIDEVYGNAIQLDDKYPELAPVVIKIMREYEEKYAKKALDQISHLVRAGQYDDAQAMVKKVLQFKIMQ